MDDSGADFVTFDMDAFDDFDSILPTESVIPLPPQHTAPAEASPSTVFTPTQPSATLPAASGQTQPESQARTFDTDYEPPLLEELGIDLGQIGKRVLATLLPFSSAESPQSDVIGSFVFDLLLGVAILMSGRFRFGYIYGFTIIGSVCEYLVLNLLSTSDVPFFAIMTTLGYSSYPLVVLAFLYFVVPQAWLAVLAVLGILWSTFSATRAFSPYKSLSEKRLLLAYPLSLYFLLFVLLVMF